MGSKKTERLVIRCTPSTIEMWRRYILLSGVKDYEEGLRRLLEDSGWAARVRALEIFQKEI